MANRGPEREFDELRAKYTALTRKYAKLVERLEKRDPEETAIFQLGSRGLELRGTALVLVRGGNIVFANAAFEALAGGGGEWVEEKTEHAFRDLRAVIADQASRVESSKATYLESSYRNQERDVHVSVKSQKGANRTPYIAVLLEDISEGTRREHELLLTREALEQRERLRILGELAAAVAHDLGNTLRGASFEIAALEGNLNGSLDGVARRVEVASQIVGRLHDFARGGSMTTVAVNLREIIDQAISLAEIELREHSAPVHVERNLPELPLVRGSAAELSLLFVNLLRNARDAMPKGGTVIVAARVRRGSVIVRIEDEGLGIPPAVLPRLFQPFFTTKSPRGAGLGLWLARRTMERLGGNIDVERGRRRGTSFSLTFPIAG